MKFSVVGTGFISPRHIEAINYVGGEIVDVVNDFRDPEAWKRVVRRKEPDCIVILTPNDLHYEIAVESMKAGKMILCEKPLAIDSVHVKNLIRGWGIFTVLQLRHHPIAKELKEKIKESDRYEIMMSISVHRDEKYYESWKGNKKRSGGILFNLGIHYFDMLLYLFGPAVKAEVKYFSDKLAIGEIRGKNYECEWKVSTIADKDRQRRVFKINGEKYNFSSKDNLSYENLHREVYKNLLEGKGVEPKDVLEVTLLIEKLNELSKK